MKNKKLKSILLKKMQRSSAVKTMCDGQLGFVR